MKLAKQTSDSVRLRSNIEILIDMFNHQATRPDKTRQIPVQSLPLLTTNKYLITTCSEMLFFSKLNYHFAYYWLLIII